MTALLNVEVPARLLESLRRSAEERGLPFAEVVVELLDKVHDSRPPTPADAVPDELIAPYIVPEFEPPPPGPTVRVTPRLVGPLKYEPCCEFEEEVPE